MDILEIVLTAIVTAFAMIPLTAVAQYYKQKANEKKRMYRGFLKEIKQNIQFAEENIKNLGKKETRIMLLTFREDFWKISLSGYILDLPSDLRDSLYKIYMEQYMIGEKLVNLRDAAKSHHSPESWEGGIKDETLKEIINLQRELKDAHDNLEKILDC